MIHGHYSVVTSAIVLSLHGVWGLDFFKPFYSGFCLGLGILQSLALEYGIATSTLQFILIGFLLIALHDRGYRVITIPCRPFGAIFSKCRGNKDDTRKSVTNALAILFLPNEHKVS